MSLSQKTKAELALALCSTVGATEIDTAITAGGGGQAITQQAAIAKAALTATTGTIPTAGGSTLIANTATPTVVELLDLCVENKAKIDAIIDALTASGVTL